MMKKFEEINVIPFIDVMLVALAIVLMSATFIVQGQLKLQLASATATTDKPFNTPFRLQIDAQQQLFWQDKLSNLEALAALFASLDPQSMISLQVDKTVPFARFVAVIDLCNKYHLENLNIQVLKTMP